MKKIIVILFCALAAAAAGYYFFSQHKQALPAVAPQMTPGVSDTEILIGSSSALTGSAASLGSNLISGAKAAIGEINASGGINGRQLKMVSYDDQYDPPKALENTQKLINQDKVFALFNYVGTPTGVKVMPIVQEAQIPLVGMFTGAEVFRNPVQKYIFNIRGSYYQETELSTKYFVDNLGLKNIAVFYQADAFGLAGLEGVKIALEKRGLKPVALGSYERGTVKVEDAVKAVAKSNAQAVIMIGTYTPLAKFVGQIKAEKPEMLFDTVSFVGSEAFAKELGQDTSNVYVTQVVPPLFYGQEFSAVQKYQQALQKYDPTAEATFGGLEGYINTKVLAEGIRQAGKNLTRAGLVQALESLQNYNVGIGASISFSPTSHQGLNKVYLTSINQDKFVLIPVK